MNYKFREKIIILQSLVILGLVALIFGILMGWILEISKI